MPRGYWVAKLDVTDEEAYARYRQLNAPVFAQFGGVFLVRGGTFEVMAGTWRSRTVVIEFDSYERALACVKSPEYQAAAEVRDRGALVDLAIVEGYDGPQPA